jgi:hypothetical protein
MSYAAAYATFCAGLISDLEERLERPLTPDEQRGIWNVGSLMRLEVVERDFDLKTTPEQIAQHLVDLAGWNEREFDDYCQSALTKIPRWLGRDLTEAERAALLRSEHVGVLLTWGERIHDAEPDEREAFVHEWLTA